MGVKCSYHPCHQQTADRPPVTTKPGPETQYDSRGDGETQDRDIRHWATEHSTRALRSSYSACGGRGTCGRAVSCMHCRPVGDDPHALPVGQLRYSSVAPIMAGTRSAAMTTKNHGELPVRPPPGADAVVGDARQQQDDEKEQSGQVGRNPHGHPSSEMRLPAIVSPPRATSAAGQTSAGTSWSTTTSRCPSSTLPPARRPYRPPP